MSPGASSAIKADDEHSNDCDNACLPTPRENKWRCERNGKLRLQSDPHTFSRPLSGFCLLPDPQRIEAAPNTVTTIDVCPILITVDEGSSASMPAIRQRLVRLEPAKSGKTVEAHQEGRQSRYVQAAPCGFGEPPG